MQNRHLTSETAGFIIKIGGSKNNKRKMEAKMKTLKASTVRRYSSSRIARWIGDNIVGYRYDSACGKLYKKYDDEFLFLCPDHHRVRMILILSDAGCIDGTCDELRKLICE